MAKWIALTLFVLAFGIFSQGCSRSEASSTEAVSSASPLEGKMENGVRVIQIKASEEGFLPSKFYVEVAEKIRLKIVSVQGNQSIYFDKLNLETDLPQGKEKVLDFTAPEKPSKINFWNKSNEDLSGYLIVKPRS